jgi:hypothetical protein
MHDAASELVLGVIEERAVTVGVDERVDGIL